MTCDPRAYHSFMAYLLERMTKELQVLLNESQGTFLCSKFYAYCSELHCRGVGGNEEEREQSER
jgi:hypothetical protein